MVLLFMLSVYGGRPVLVEAYPDMVACQAAVREAKDSVGFMGDHSARFYCIPAPKPEAL
jgi:hypothetical protein